MRVSRRTRGERGEERTGKVGLALAFVPALVLAATAREAADHLYLPPAWADRVVFFHSFEDGVDRPEINCRCRAEKKPVLHGPYQHLSHRYQSRTQTILLTKSKLPYARAWVSNYKRLIQTVYELCEVNFRLLRYHHEKLETAP